MLIVKEIIKNNLKNMEYENITEASDGKIAFETLKKSIVENNKFNLLKFNERGMHR